MTDPLEALRDFLLGDAAVAALAGTRVFVGKVPREEVPSMPRHAVKLAPAGGGVLGLGYQGYGDQRVDVDCYGETERESWVLYLAVYEALKHLQRAVEAGCLLHWARPSSRGLTAVDPDTDWPVSVSSWQVLASEEEVA